MRQHMVKHARWQLRHKLLARGVGSAGQRQLTVGAAAILFFALSAQAEAYVNLPPIGGGGGNQFARFCSSPDDHNHHLLLTGVGLRTGDDVDAIQPICVEAYGPADVGPAVVKGVEGGNHESLRKGRWFGGQGGGPGRLLCPPDTPIVIGMYVRAEGTEITSVNNIHLFCGVAAAAQKLSASPNAVFDAPNISSGVVEGTQYCPPGLVAVGINGRYGQFVDAVGLTCGEPTLTSRGLGKPIGRVKVPTTPDAPLDAPPGPPRPICDVAREARARNSPAADGLEAQCLATVNALAARGEAIVNQDPFALALRNQQPQGLARRGFDIGMAAAEGQTAPGAGKQSIQNSLSSAEQVGFDAAVKFSLERNRDLERNTNSALAAKGKAIANQDPLAVALRNQQPDDSSRRGFDIGMAAAEGHTAPGAGKQKLLESLDQAERGGFSIAVSFSLERNRNLDLAKKGAKVALADPVVAEARTVEADVFYRLGFDIATGIFGDPALGGNGNTAWGCGSEGIRDSLSAAGQTGFNASVKLHLSRNYKP